MRTCHLLEEAKESNEISIAIVGQCNVVRGELEKYVESAEDIFLIGSYQNAAQLIECLKRIQLDVIVVGLVLKEDDFLRRISKVVGQFTETKILVVSQYHDSAYAERVCGFGAAGYIDKDTPIRRLLTAVRNLHWSRMGFEIRGAE